MGNVPPLGALYHMLGLHIYEPDRVVIAAVYRMLTPTSRHARDQREERHRLYREILKRHHDARALAVEFRL